MTRLPIHMRVVAEANDTEQTARLVECPAARQSVGVEACKHCGYGRGESYDEELEGYVVECVRAEEDRTKESFDSRFRIVPTIQLASRDVHCATVDASVEWIARTMIENTISCVPVVDALGAPLGMVTHVDLVAKPYARTAGEAMTSPAVSVGEMAPISRAAAVMAFEGVHHLPVINQAGAIVAVLSSLDVLRHLGQEQGFFVPAETRRRREGQADEDRDFRHASVRPGVVRGGQ